MRRLNVAKNVRMPEELWEAIQDEAMRCHMSASQFVRQATLATIAYRHERRGDDLRCRLGLEENRA